MTVYDELTEIGYSFMDIEPQQKQSQCGRLTSILEMELEDRNIKYSRVIGSIKFNGKSEDHTYVKIPPCEFKDEPSGSVIVDVTVHQFTSSVDTAISLDSAYNLPDKPIGIFTPQDPIYTIYN